MALKSIGQIVERVPNVKNGQDVGYLSDTIILEDSIEKANREETVRLYYFAKTIKHAFEEILHSFAEPHGRGFWITAEYGVGKSHFLATLACLLGDTSDQVWNCVHDSDVKNYQFRFKDKKLFPIVGGLRGKSAISADKPITLLTQLEREIDRAIAKHGLQKLVNLTPIYETLEMYEQFVPDLRNAVDDFIRRQTGRSAKEVKGQDAEFFATTVREFFKKSHLPFEPAVNTEDRLKHLYDQIVNPRTGYNGLLIILDEFEAWASQRPITTPEGIFDSNVLQSLTELLPSNHNCQIYTIVASQVPMPAQLSGSTRFAFRPLLAGQGAERDYHVICAHRVRKYKTGGEAEADLYYHQLWTDFETYKNETKEGFRETFPFHPLSYELVRRFTSSVGEPGLRLGINILYDLMKGTGALNQLKPLTAPDTLEFSPNFQIALQKPRFLDGYRKYQDAIRAVERVFKDETDQKPACEIITLLFLHYVVFADQGLPLTQDQIAEATLTRTDGISGGERAFILLQRMVGQISQIAFDPTKPDKGARFIPKKAGPTPGELLEEVKRDPAIVNAVADRWTRLLFAPPTQTMGIQTMFAGQELDKPNKEKCTVNQIEYDGEVKVTHSWKSDLGLKLGDPYIHFRIIYLLDSTPFDQSEIEDQRIIVLQPAPLPDHTIDVAREFIAAEKLKSDYAPGKQAGPEAAEIRAFADTAYSNALQNIITSQIKQFAQGKVYTKDGLALDLQAAYAKPTSDQRHHVFIRPLLTNAYKEIKYIFDFMKLDKPVQLLDAKNLFIGLLQGDQGKAVRSTLEQKAAGLGLAKPDDPKTLNADHSELFRILSERLSAKGALVISPLLKELAAPPYGIPVHILAVQLLMFVRYRSQPKPVEIELNPNHNIMTTKGDRLTGNRITRSNVREITWQNNIEDRFNALFEVKGPDWNTLVPYAQVFIPEAKTAVQPVEIDKQTDAFISHIKEEHKRLVSAESSLLALEKSLEQKLSEAESQSFKDMRDLLAVTALEEFDERRKKISEDLQYIRDSYGRAQKLRQLAESAAQLIQQYEVLKKLDLGSSGELAAKRDLLLARFSMPSLTSAPSAAGALLIDCERYLDEVKSVQKAHAQRMKDELTALAAKLSSAEKLIASLELLNTLETLGPPQGQELQGQAAYVSGLIKKELSGESNQHQQLSYSPPRMNIDSVVSGVKFNLEKRLAILRSELEKIVANSKTGDQLTTVKDLLAIGTIEEVGQKLSPTLTEQIRKLLELANTVTHQSKVLDQLAQKFPTVGVDDVEPVVAEFKKLLLTELGDGNRAGKRLKITLK